MAAVDVVLILGSLTMVMLALLRRRAVRRSVATPMDAPARLLVWAIGFLPADRADWGQAMVGELGQLQLRQQAKRWRFALGCLAATLLLPARRAGAGRLVIVLVVAAAVGCAGLVCYGLLRYPALLAGRGTWPALATFCAVLAGFTLLAVVLVRRGAAAGLALVGGLGTAAVWIVFGYTARDLRTGAAGALVVAAGPAACATGGADGPRRGRYEHGDPGADRAGATRGARPAEESRGFSETDGCSARTHGSVGVGLRGWTPGFAGTEVGVRDQNCLGE